MDAGGGSNAPFGLSPLSCLPSPTKVMCNWAGLLPVNSAARVGVQRGDGA